MKWTLLLAGGAVLAALRSEICNMALLTQTIMAFLLVEDAQDSRACANAGAM